MAISHVSNLSDRTLYAESLLYHHSVEVRVEEKADRVTTGFKVGSDPKEIRKTLASVVDGTSRQKA